ncbi:hypothetical protein BGX28_010543 [Mortierella sp. GBA30]|nr:hypothetical protein BGX28_010543 [Mortierella sp. GBA30]
MPRPLYQFDDQSPTLRHLGYFEEPNSRPKKCRVTKEEKIVRILDSLRLEGLSLRQFLLGAFESNNVIVRTHMGMFYSRGGPAAVVNAWGRILKGKRKYDKNFVSAAVSTVAGRARRELRAVTEKGVLRSPALALSSETIDKFSLESIDTELRTRAPHLFQLLNELVGRCKRFYKPAVKLASNSPVNSSSDTPANCNLNHPVDSGKSTQAELSNDPPLNCGHNLSVNGSNYLQANPSDAPLINHPVNHTGNTPQGPSNSLDVNSDINPPLNRSNISPPNISSNPPVTIGSNPPVTIGNNLPVTIDNNLPVTIGNNLPVTIGNNLPVTIGSNPPVTIGNNLPVTIGNNLPVNSGSNSQAEPSNNSPIHYKDSPGKSADNVPPILPQINLEATSKGPPKVPSKKDVESILENSRDRPSASNIVTTMGSMLVFYQSQRSNALQMMFGLYLAAKNCPKRVINLIASLGLSVSHQTVHEGLTGLTDHMLKDVQDAVQERGFSIVFDNINFPNRKSDQRLHNMDTFENGTTATIVVSDHLRLSAPTPAPQKDPSPLEFIPDQQNRSHIRIVYGFHLIHALQRHFTTFDSYITSDPTIDVLRTEKTLTFPLPSMRYDQATNEGNLDVLTHITQIFLKLPPGWFTNNTRIIISGDQLTVSRVTSLQELRASDTTPFNRLQWAVPILQLFHLQMLFCSTILRTHYGSISTPGSLAFFIAMLDRKRLNLESPNYHTADELLRQIFDAMVMRIFEVELELGEVKLESFGMQDNFKRDKRILAAIEIIRKKYLSDLDGLASRLGIMNANAALFLRDMMLYMEFGAAIKVADIGRILEVLKVMTVLFQAGGTKNYANELLRLAYGIRHAWSDQMTRAVATSWLINTNGKPDGWIPADLYQEHNNLLTKTIYAAKGSNMSWETLAKLISSNIRTFSRISAIFETEYHISYNSSFHTTVSAAEDIRRIKEALASYNILGATRSEDHDVPLVRDLVKEGIHNLIGGRYRKFLESITNGNGAQQDDAVIEGLEIEDMEAEEFVKACFNTV